MLSDALDYLADNIGRSLAEIRDYQDEYPEIYDGTATEINAITTALDEVVRRAEALREFYDTPPSATAHE